jgi:ABC-type lipoprotein release transport system permease subunit
MLRHNPAAAVALAMVAAVCTGVICGSLWIGESIRQSLERQALSRIGGVSCVLSLPTFIPADLAERISRQAGCEVVPVIILPARLASPANEKLSNSVQIIASPAGFLSLPADFCMPDAANFWINPLLSADLSSPALDAPFVLKIPTNPDAPVYSTFGRRKISDAMTSVRVSLAGIYAGTYADFALGAGGRQRNIFVSLEWLRQRLKIDGKANCLLVKSDNLPEMKQRLEGILAVVSEAADYGLSLEKTDGGFIVRSDRFMFPEEYLAAIENTLATVSPLDSRLRGNDGREMNDESKIVPRESLAATQMRQQEKRVRHAPRLRGNDGREIAFAKHSIYLANRIALTKNKKTMTPYSLVGGDREIPSGQADINQWLADDLGAKSGDELTLTFYQSDESGKLSEAEQVFVIRNIVPVDKWRNADKWLPPYPGLNDNMADWNPPFPIDLKLIRQKDEDYWDQFRATPKVMLSLETVKAFWRPESGITAININVTPHPDHLPLEGEWVSRLLGRALALSPAGMKFRDIRAEALIGAQGSSDFASLFLGLGFFLIAAAALLLWLLNALAAESRLKTWGTLAAVGFSPRQIKSLIIRTGLLTGVAGALLGIGLGGVYAALLAYALKGVWSGAVASLPVALYFSWKPLAGAAAGIAIAYGSAWMVARGINRHSPRELLKGSGFSSLATGCKLQAWEGRGVSFPLSNCHSRAGGNPEEWRAGSPLDSRLRGNDGREINDTRKDTTGESTAATRIRLRDKLIKYLLFSLAVGLIYCGKIHLLPEMAAFVLAGIMLLAGGMLLASRILSTYSAELTNLTSLARRYAGRRKGRSLTGVLLLASATFLLCTVTVTRQRFSHQDVSELNSGAGGFVLSVRASLPVLPKIGTDAGDAELALSPETRRILRDAKIFRLREKRGENAGCLNLNQPQAPTVLALPDELIARGGFSFAAHLSLKGNESPWNLLQRPGDDAVNVFADEASAQWILHKNLGDIITVPGRGGNLVRLRLAGLLQGSIFAGELLAGERNFQKFFDEGSGGWQRLLVACPLGKRKAISAALVEALSDYGAESEATESILAKYAEVQNAYLSAFAALGGMGLLLGACGMAAVMARNIFERRQELALLAALGFSKKEITRLLLRENGGLIAAGIALGTMASLAAMSPRILSDPLAADWATLAVTLAVTIMAGLAACYLAARSSMKHPLLAALRSE